MKQGLIRLRSRGRSRLAGSCVGAVIALAALAPAASADPGTPGVHSAQVGVYGQSGVGGETIGGAPAPETQRGAAPAGEEQGVSPTTVGGQPGSGSAPASASGPTSMPFTGFLAGGVLAIGLLLLIGGLLLRMVAGMRARGQGPLPTQQ
jgi:hypothetical protein